MGAADRMDVDIERDSFGLAARTEASACTDINRIWLIGTFRKYAQGLRALNFVNI